MQNVLVNPYWGVFFGVILSLLFQIAVTVFSRNPASVPLKNVIVKAIPGFVIYLTIWTIFSEIGSLASCQTISWVKPIGVTGTWFLSMAFGFAIPQVEKFQDLIQYFPRNLATESLFRALQDLNEATSRNLAKLIDQEEWRLSFPFFMANQNQRFAVDALFEQHKILIAEKNFSLAGDENPFNIFNIHCTEMKVRFLVRFMGIIEFGKAMRDYSNQTGIAFTTWPVGICDRRIGNERRINKKNNTIGSIEHRIKPFGRRKTDSIYLKRLIVRKIDLYKKYELDDETLFAKN